MDKIAFTLPIKTISESNVREPWFKAHRRHKTQRTIVRLALSRNSIEWAFPLEITLTRIAPRFLDVEENLPMAFKWIKDEIGACIFPERVVHYRNKGGTIVRNTGHADSDARVTWCYAQEKGKIPSVRIEIEQTKEG